MERDEQQRGAVDRATIDELLMQRVTGALSAPEAEALARVGLALDTLPLDALALEWELAAAELSVLLASDAFTPADALPAHLAERIVGVGEALTKTQSPMRTSAGTASRADVSAGATPIVATRSGALRRAAVLWGGWALAAAAAVVVMLNRSPEVRPPAVVSADAPLADARVAQLRDSLLNSDSALVRLAWTATGDSSARGATGDVVWSSRAQRGVMRIAGLQSNDRRKTQYQLWIFDKNRDERYPVDGGVFDIPPGAHEVLVPIDARVPVGEAVLFAITVEPPGGVVVSKRDRIALVAKPAG